MSWDLLEQTYDTDGLVLALGGGVSVGSRIPQWIELIDRLATETIGKEEFADLRNADLPLPVIASIVQEHCRDRDDFIERVRTALYLEFPFFSKGLSETSGPQLVRLVRDDNPTLHAVASMCAVPDGGKDAFVPNPRIKAMVTFNLDALLQAYANARFSRRLLRTIERASAPSRTDTISIYHMHGFLRFDEKAGDVGREAPDALVLTEQDYFEFFNDPMSLFNYTFLYLLRESSCLFIGLSMKDENIRRLLHYSRTERVRSFEKVGLGHDEARRRALRHFAILPRGPAARMMEESLRRLGTRVLWVNHHDEVAGRLREVYESTGADWESVA